MDLSIIVSLYNEYENVDELFRRIQSELHKLALSYEIIFIDDGSTDGTTVKIKELQKSNPHLKLVIFDRNYGQTPALIAGFQKAKGEMIITMDGDLQNDPADIVQLIVNLRAGYDMVNGWRIAREDSVIFRKIPSKIANAIISFITGVEIHDFGCSLKGFQKKIAKNIILYPEMHRFIPIFAASIGARIKEIPVTHKPRLRGKTKYGITMRWRILFDLIKVKLLLDFSSKPASLLTVISIPFWILGAGLIFNYFNEYMNNLFSMSPSIVIIGTGVLYVELAVSLVLFGYIAELLCATRDYKQNKILSKVLMYGKK